jgi:hypothetical protein
MLFVQQMINSVGGVVPQAVITRAADTVELWVK